MIYTIKIDDSSPTGKRIINDLRKHSKVVKFEKTTNAADKEEGYVSDEFESNVKENIFTYSKDTGIVGFIPDGYVTGEEFFLGIKKELKKRCIENGLLQQNCSE
jgi:hypothetical protein